jgi:Holliday junction resolvase RusA-like endonuclease
MTESATLTLTIDGPIVGKERARHAVYRKGSGYRVRMYTPTKTISAEARVAAAWRNAGSHTMLIGAACRLDVTVTLERPQSHYTKDGTLGAAGRRSPHPTKRPDLDNVLKTILDGLNGLAYHDDALVTELASRKVWGTAPRIIVEISIV